ncbi:hypothetical protein PR202_gb08486 [Eleusine coracana subsp. coracana]|uniref:Uncharacterized protein n=1 Tax=Eleusine coracana subsp. coracana TaxID=191504 RepID=A0AAV5EFM7_ELECO|nr:hypothetical protein PR202_gb08486 [Eleusine coracana subsp. coracana]
MSRAYSRAVFLKFCGTMKRCGAYRVETTPVLVIIIILYSTRQSLIVIVGHSTNSRLLQMHQMDPTCVNARHGSTLVLMHIYTRSFIVIS